jgi:nucleoside-diphosphate-sugar epimerase
LADLKVLVTGGGGFIGSHLCRRLCRAGAEVHATSRTERATTQAGPTWWQADLSDLSIARRLFTSLKPDIIYHLAGSVGADPGLNLVIPTFQSLLMSTVNVLLCANEVGNRRIILTGSLTEPPPGAVGATPSSPYAAAKWAASGYGRMFHKLYQTPVVVLCPFMVYGPAQATSKLIPSVTLSLLTSEAPKLSSGSQKGDWVYVADVIEGFVAAAVAPGIEGATIDLGSGTLVSVRNIVGQLVAIIGTQVEPIFGALPDRPGENELAANTTAAAAMLGWRASTSMESGLRQTVEWYRSRVE